MEVLALVHPDAARDIAQLQLCAWDFASSFFSLGSLPWNASLFSISIMGITKGGKRTRYFV
jgi:hypothetical protein